MHSKFLEVTAQRLTYTVTAQDAGRIGCRDSIHTNSPSGFLKDVTSIGSVR